MLTNNILEFLSVVLGSILVLRFLLPEFIKHLKVRTETMASLYAISPTTLYFNNLCVHFSRFITNLFYIVVISKLYKVSNKGSLVEEQSLKPEKRRDIFRCVLVCNLVI